MMTSKWLSPLKFGIVLGVFIGIAIAGKAALIHGYLGYHLYNTFAKLLAVNIDYWTVLAMALCYLLAVAAKLITSTGTKQKPSNTPLTGILVLIATVAIRHFGHSAETSPEVGYRPTTFNDILRILIAFACPILGYLVIKWTRRRPNLSARISGSIQKPFLVAYAGISRLFVSSLAILVLANLSAGVLHLTTEASVRKKPNIIFIMMDTTRADHLGCYGYHVNTTPNLDKFAKESIRFDRAIAQAPMTQWSVPSFMTSQYPEDLARNGSQSQLLVTDSTLTLAGELKDQGYVTSAAISNPILHGCEQGFDSFEQLLNAENISSPWVLNNAIKQLALSKNRPFFQFLLFMDPHSPYILHDEYEFSSPYKKKKLRWISTFLGSNARDFSANEKTFGRIWYDSEIRYTDEHIGKLFDELKRQGLYDDSLIVFLADHGEEFGDHGGYFHGLKLFNESISVPVMIKMPRQRQGRVVKGVFNLLDVFPTILKLINGNVSELNLRGTAIDLKTTEKLPDELIFSATDKIRSATNTRYKCIVNLDKNNQVVYDLLKDPGEKHDVSNRERAVTQYMSKAILARDAESRQLGGKLPTRSGETEQEKQRLRSLGYIGK